MDTSRPRRRPTADGQPLDVTGYNPSHAWAAGAIVSNAADLSHFYRALMSGRLLAQPLLREMKKTVAEDPTDPNTTFRYGLGLERVNDTCGANWGHSRQHLRLPGPGLLERPARVGPSSSPAPCSPRPRPPNPSLATVTDLALCAKAKAHMKSTLLGDTDHIEVRGLRRVYGTGEGAFEAVRGIDLVVGAGTIVALLGTNGAGKTSALEVVEGLARPTAGTGSRARFGPGHRPRGSTTKNGRAAADQRVPGGPDCRGDAADVGLDDDVARALSPMRWPSSILPAAPTYGCEACPAASSDASTWRARCSGIQTSCCSTSRPLGSTPKVGAGSGTSSQPCGIGVGRCS